MNNITIFNNLINSASSSMRINSFNSAKVASQMKSYNSQYHRDIDCVRYPIICGKTKCGNSIYEQCQSQVK